jgi:branched-chain amino acid aminotransferase
VAQNLFSNINGSIVPTNETDMYSSNESVRSRYGLYETILYKNGAIEQAEYHWARLWLSLTQLGFIIPEDYTPSFFEAQIHELARLNRLKDVGRIRIQFFALEAQKPLMPFYFMEAISINKSLNEWNIRGLVLGILKDFKKPIIKESNCKINHSLHIPLAKKAMVENNWDDALLLNTEDRIIESSIANLFWIKNDVIYTTPLSEGCLEGTIRAWLLLQLRNNGYEIIEKKLSQHELFEADEVFLTNSIRQIKWVERIEQHYFGNQKSKELYQKIFKK